MKIPVLKLASTAPWWKSVNILPIQPTNFFIDSNFNKLVLPSHLIGSEPAPLVNASSIEDLQLTPAMIFINSKSGGKKGGALMSSFRSLPLHSSQICDLNKDRPRDKLLPFRNSATHLNVMCCGGDGTINWVMDELSCLDMANVNSFGIVPLGTGNDLYLQACINQRKKMPTEVTAFASSVEQIVSSPKSVLAHHAWNMNKYPRNQVALDRWAARIQPLEGMQKQRERDKKESNNGSNSDNESSIEVADASIDESNQAAPASPHTDTSSSSTAVSATKTTFFDGLNIFRFFFRFLSQKVKLKLKLGSKRNRVRVFSNYMGFGVDGAVSLSFDALREHAPFLFFSAVMNKLWYGLCGLYQIVLGKHKRDLSKTMKLQCDGEDVSVPPGVRGIIVLNINSYAGGTKLWRADESMQQGFGARQGPWEASSMDDGLLEVMGVYGIRHLGLIKGGMASAVPLCQGRHLVFNCSTQIPMQVDGEPFMAKPCLVEVRWAQRVNVTVPVVTSAALGSEALARAP